MSTELLREVISLLISESSKDEGKAEDRDPKSKTPNLMLEPDYTKPSDVRSQAETDETDEVSVSANAAGVSVPLAYSPEGSPQSSRKVTKSREEVTRVVGDAFGGAKPIKSF